MTISKQYTSKGRLKKLKNPSCIYLQEDSAVMFQKMMHSLDLPVCYKKLKLRDVSTVTNGPIVR